jgi:hypothetical protein
MNDKIKITCTRCKHKWEKSLHELEILQTTYRGDEKEKPKGEIVDYRAVCPVCGTYNIIKVQED